MKSSIKSLRAKLIIYALASLAVTIAVDVLCIKLLQGFMRKNEKIGIYYSEYNNQKLYEPGPILTNSLSLDVLVFVSFSIIVFLVVYLLLTRKIVSYFKAITKQIEIIKNGDLNNLIEVEGEDEMSILAESINEMSIELKETIQKERMAEKEKNDLITSVAHDLRTPLTSIMGYLDLIINDEKMDNTTKTKYFNIVYDKSKRLQKLIVELFDYTRYSKNQITPKLVIMDITRFMEQIIEEFYPAFCEKGLICNTCIEDKSIFVMADGDLLARAIGNLLSNAVKYGADGKQILISTELMGNKILISITNFGQVIPEKDLEKIFDKFYRVESSRSLNTGGTGLGLAIAKNIIELHKGSISVNSSENGTVFEIFLDVYEKEAINEKGN